MGEFVTPMLQTRARLEEYGTITDPRHTLVACLIDMVHDLGYAEQRIRSVEVARIRLGRAAERWAISEDRGQADRIISDARAKGSL